MKWTLFIYYFVALICASGCGGNQSASNSDSTQSHVADSTIINKNGVNDTLPIEARLCEAYLDIVYYLDSQGYVYDSNRLTKVYTALSDNKRIYARKHVFYLCNPEETGLAEIDLHKFDSVLLMNDQPVIEYFFTTPTKVNDYYTDGIIEQWELNDTAKARLTAEQIIFTEMGFGHDAPPMVCYLGTQVYVFRSRATPSMYAIRPIFREFVKRNGAINVERPNGWM